MDLSIIILNYKSKGLVKYCLKGIKSVPLPFSYEIIVVDNDSGDGIEEMLKQDFPEVRFFASDKNKGFATGNNIGLRQAKGRYLMILNPDIVIMDDAIAKLYTFMERRRDVALAGPRLNNPDGTIQYSCYTFPGYLIPLYRRTFLGKLSFGQRALKKYLMTEADHSLNQEVDWLLGACIIIRRQAIEQVGLMDERFFLYFEDVDWCRRFVRAGYKVCYVPEAEMVHYHHRQSAAQTFPGFLNRSARIHIYSGLKYFWKYRKEPGRVPAQQTSFINS